MLFRLLTVLVVCLMALALPATPAQGQCGGPAIDLSLHSGAPGTEVAVYGQRFVAGSYIDIYYDGTIVATDRTSVRGTFTLTFTVPEGHKGFHKVLADAGTDKAEAYFTAKPGLIVTPEKGPVGTTVTVTGQGFAKDERGIELRYYIGYSYTTIKANIRANARGSWETTFQIPESSKGEHKIDAEVSGSTLYQVKYAIFEVISGISIDKSSGIVGDTITITANKFAGYEREIRILFAGQEVVTDIIADSKGEWEASFEVPEMPTGEYSVTAEGDQTKKEDIGELSFEIEPGILLSPDEGHVGMNLTVTGRGFDASEDMDIMYEDSQVRAATTDAKGNFEVSFPVPKSKHGECQVTVENAGETEATAIFTIESKAPETPKLISPPDGGRVGLTGRVTPTFDWSAVSDDSGVCYHLQIATSENVTDTGEFADDAIFSIEGLVETSYTLKETEALPLGTYYWIVQAVDGAENESVWSAAYSLRVGLLPRGGLIAVIVVAVVLFIALIRALVVRKGIYYDRW